jgi:hypothetical protein
VIRATVFAVLLSAVGVGCAGGDATIDASATAAVVLEGGFQAAPGDDTQENVKTSDPFDDFGLSRNAVATTDRETPVWLVNQSPQSLIVTAWGGAENVVVDTVGASDSTFVRWSCRLAHPQGSRWETLPFRWTRDPSEPHFPSDCGWMTTPGPSSVETPISVTAAPTISYDADRRLAPFLLVYLRWKG